MSDSTTVVERTNGTGDGIEIILDHVVLSRGERDIEHHSEGVVKLRGIVDTVPVPVGLLDDLSPDARVVVGSNRARGGAKLLLQVHKRAPELGASLGEIVDHVVNVVQAIRLVSIIRCHVTIDVVVNPGF